MKWGYVIRTKPCCCLCLAFIVLFVGPWSSICVAGLHALAKWANNLWLLFVLCLDCNFCCKVFIMALAERSIHLDTPILPLIFAVEGFVDWPGSNKEAPAHNLAKEMVPVRRSSNLLNAFFFCHVGGSTPLLSLTNFHNAVEDMVGGFKGSSSNTAEWMLNMLGSFNEGFVRSTKSRGVIIKFLHRFLRIGKSCW